MTLTPETLPRHAVWEDVFLAKPSGIPYKDGRYARVCKVCGSDFPEHRPDCEFASLRKRLEAAECPDKSTAGKLAEWIEACVIPSPWRDTGTRLRAFGKWLAALAGEKP